MVMSQSEAGRLGAEKSKIIANLKKQERIILYDKNPSFCKNCNRFLSYVKRKHNFCGKSCAAIFNNSKFPKRLKQRLNCKCCSKILKVGNYDFCDSKCQQRFKWDVRKKQIELTGIEKSPIVAKKYLIECQGNFCQICKMSDEWQEKKLVLVLDHIDGNSENNIISNQRLVCPNCDSQLPTYKGRNKGNGRYFRKIRYKEGKSF